MKKLKIVLLACLTVIALTMTACQQTSQAQRTYEDVQTGIAFQYPSKIILAEEPGQILLQHGI